ncbi:zinc ribbon domain-containing protein [Labrenzia sp. R4_1]|uniref:zinc ribbon domain-containing protein n=1 Tax=Labrenzia sp. R4_1 TaxID=2821106 RepID=UPI001ADB2A82|nr:zinc ribbon domain-containing protein [Labrenzia sp. R4_1]MBO9424705.1 zinc ribbon domain-containing protein [Labrenzia sp. R4_1]
MTMTSSDTPPTKPLWPFSILSYWMSGQKRPPRTNCWACGSEIKPNQKYCTKCDHWQTWRRHFNFSTAILSLLVAIMGLSIPILDRVSNFYTPLKASGVLTSLDGSKNLAIYNGSQHPLSLTDSGSCRLRVPSKEPKTLADYFKPTEQTVRWVFSTNPELIDPNKSRWLDVAFSIANVTWLKSHRLLDDSPELALPMTEDDYEPPSEEAAFSMMLIGLPFSDLACEMTVFYQGELRTIELKDNTSLELREQLFNSWPAYVERIKTTPPPVVRF